MVGCGLWVERLWHNFPTAEWSKANLKQSHKTPEIQLKTVVKPLSKQRNLIMRNKNLISVTFVSGPSWRNSGSKKKRIFRKSARVWNKANARKLMYRTLAPSEKQTNKKDQLHNLYHQKELKIIKKKNWVKKWKNLSPIIYITIIFIISI